MSINIKKGDCLELMKDIPDGVGCQNTNRNFIGFEIDETYFNIAKERLKKTRSNWMAKKRKCDLHYV